MTRLHDRNDQRHEGATGDRRSGFARSEDGSLIIFGLMIFVLMLAAGGMGVDFMRYEAQRARLQATLDRAVLAAASLDQPLAPRDVVIDYFERGGLGAYIDPDDIIVTEDAASRYVAVNASMEVPSIFLNFVGITELEAPASGAAQQTASQTEISLVLDVSGSMSWWSYSGGASKINILKQAATDFINIVMCDPADSTKTTDCTVPEDQISVSVVPYSEQVLLGETLASEFNVSTEHTDSSCVTFDQTDFDTTAISDLTALNRTGHFDARSSWDRAASDGNRTCKTDAWREVTAVESDAQILRDRIDDLGANGNTSIDIGMKWGAALLDPAARPVVASLYDGGFVDEAFADRPLDYTERGINKVIVLMTDGENTDQYYLYDGYRDGPSPIWRTEDKVSTWSGSEYVYSVYKASTNQYYWPHLGRYEDHPYGTGTYRDCSYWSCTTRTEAGGDALQLSYPELWKVKPWNWYKSFDWLSSPGSRQGTTEKNDRLDDICTAAKDQGMTVFTIGFETSSWAGTVLQKCATDVGYYFDVDGMDLTDAFASIAREISKLKLVN
jgi:Putative Flp pilus-assembly TadE/G-like